MNANLTPLEGFRPGNFRQHPGTRQLVKKPAGDVIHQNMRIGHYAKNGAAMRAAHRNAMKGRANESVANIDLIHGAVGDGLFTFRTKTVIQQ
jgi:hypothetical protein